MHPGSLEYYEVAFAKNGFDLVNHHNFTYTKCSYCPGGYWPDNKAADHTIMIYENCPTIKYRIGKIKGIRKR